MFERSFCDSRDSRSSPVMGNLGRKSSKTKKSLYQMEQLNGLIEHFIIIQPDRDLQKSVLNKVLTYAQQRF